MVLKSNTFAGYVLTAFSGVESHCCLKVNWIWRSNILNPNNNRNERD